MNRFALVLIVLLITDCATKSSILVDPTRTTTAGVGEVFFSHEMDWFTRYDLTITELTPDKITFQYNEYKFNEGQSLVWSMKQGLNKTLTFSLKENIHIKGAEFEPISIINSRLTYKRVK